MSLNQERYETLLKNVALGVTLVVGSALGAALAVAMWKMVLS